MNIINSRKTIRQRTQALEKVYREESFETFCDAVGTQLLQEKIRFPLLESAAHDFEQILTEDEAIAMGSRIMTMQTIGGNVIAGMLLRFRLETHFRLAHAKAVEFICYGNEWYVCDIIGERVIGHSLLYFPEETLPLLRNYRCHDNKWIVRSVGVATHYAVKKGLKKQYAEVMFLLLTELGGSTELHTRRGVGWGIKTIAKFHPDIIQKHGSLLENDSLKPWFHYKIAIGLNRADKYAGKYNE